MFGIETLSAETIGVLSAFIAGLLTLVPSLGLTDQRRALVAVVTLIAGVLIQTNFNFVDWQDFMHKFLMAAVYSVVSYKLVLQPLVLPKVDAALGAVGMKSKYRG